MGATGVVGGATEVTVGTRGVGADVVAVHAPSVPTAVIRTSNRKIKTGALLHTISSLLGGKLPLAKPIIRLVSDTAQDYFIS